MKSLPIIVASLLFAGSALASEEARVAAILAGLPALPPVPGGETRQASVRAGLEAL